MEYKIKYVYWSTQLTMEKKCNLFYEVRLRREGSQADSQAKHNDYCPGGCLYKL